VFTELGQALEKIKGAQSTIEITGNTYVKHEDSHPGAKISKNTVYTDGEAYPDEEDK
jgi:hypothetical protein